MIEWNQLMDKTKTWQIQNIVRYGTDILAQCLKPITPNIGQCIICDCSHPAHPQLCEHCYSRLPLFDMENVYGDLLNWPAINKLFIKRHFDQLISVTPHLWPTNEWLNQFKYHKRHDYHVLLAFLLKEQWQHAANYIKKPDIVLSIPLHISKWQSRGFNQAHLLASKFAEGYQLDYQRDILIRIKKQKAQVGKSGAERRKQIKGSFTLLKPELIAEKNILLIDDVLTTGATVNEICRLLKAAGAIRVTVLTLTLSLEKCQ